jgi:DNA-binding Xre family transcriptional regulator
MGSPVSESFGAMLKLYRERLTMPNPHGEGFVVLSQNQLARRAAIDPAFVNRLEAGKQQIARRPVVLRLADALECSQVETDELLIAAGLVPTTIAHMDSERRRALLVVLAG